jgi:hypothetical protein
MDYGDISRKFLMELIDKVDKKIWEQYGSYENVAYYIEKWHEDDEDYTSYNHWENFYIQYKDDGQKQINLKATLHKMPPDIVVKIAIELGIDTPGFLPAIPTFKNVLKDENQSAYQNFDRATKNAYEHPDNAVALASSTLEGIIKTILEHDTFNEDAAKLKNLSLAKLAKEIVKKFGFDDATKCPPEIITLAGQLRSIAATVDDLRSDKSTAHGKSGKDYVIDDPLWAMFTINTCATVGLFLWEYFERKYLPKKAEAAKVVEDTDDAPINLDDIPF